MRNIDEINAIANELANDNQKPTVALVKAKLTSNIPLPTIIAALKSWQHQPDFTRESIAPKESNTAQVKTSEENAALKRAIDSAIAPLVEEIKQLRKEVEALRKAK